MINFLNIFTKRLRQKISSSFPFESSRGSCLSKEERADLSAYAKSKGVRISNYKSFTGEISIIKEVIDDVWLISQDFPLLLHGRNVVEVNFDYYCSRNDFASTYKHVIYLNAHLYSDKKQLSEAYKSAVEEGHFVANTNYRSIVRHEMGHVVCNLYHFNPLQMAMDLLNTQSSILALDVIRNELSLYSGEFPDGREIISESFSAYYSGVDNEFAKRFVETCISLKGGA